MIFILLLELVEGDIIIDRKLKKIRADHGEHRSKRSLFYKKKTHEHRWKDGFIPYVISNNLGMSVNVRFICSFMWH